MKHLTRHTSLDVFKSKKEELLKPHVALVKGEAKPLLFYSGEGQAVFSGHLQGSAAKYPRDAAPELPNING